MKRCLALFLTLTLLLTPLAALGAGITITEQPVDAGVPVGGNVSFHAAAKGYTGITWKLEDPATGEIVNASKAAARFPGLKVSGANARTLKLSRVPAEMNGWGVFCSFSAGGTRAATRTAMLTVKGADVRETPEPASYAPGTYVVRAVGCDIRYLDRQQKPAGSALREIDFSQPYVNPVTGGHSPGGVIDVQITSALPGRAAPDHWLINGVAYRFTTGITSFRVIGLNTALTVEAVAANGSDTTRGAARQTDGRLVAETVSASMQHLTTARERGGDPFRRFDFTDEYLNAASGRRIPGGTFDAGVTADSRPGMYVAYWKFSGVEFHFSKTVSRFTAVGNDHSIVWEPVYARSAVQQTTAPGPTPIKQPQGPYIIQDPTHGDWTNGPYTFEPAK